MKLSRKKRTTGVSSGTLPKTSVMSGITVACPRFLLWVSTLPWWSGRRPDLGPQQRPGQAFQRWILRQKQRLPQSQCGWMAVYMDGLLALLDRWGSLSLPASRFLFKSSRSESRNFFPIGLSRGESDRDVPVTYKSTLNLHNTCMASTGTLTASKSILMASKSTLCMPIKSNQKCSKNISERKQNILVWSAYFFLSFFLSFYWQPRPKRFYNYFKSTIDTIKCTHKYEGTNAERFNLFQNCLKSEWSILAIFNV